MSATVPQSGSSDVTKTTALPVVPAQPGSPEATSIPALPAQAGTARAASGVRGQRSTRHPRRTAAIVAGSVLVLAGAGAVAMQARDDAAPPASVSPTVERNLNPMEHEAHRRLEEQRQLRLDALNINERENQAARTGQ